MRPPYLSQAEPIHRNGDSWSTRQVIPRDSWRLSSTQGSATLNPTRAKLSSLVELLRLRALEQPEQRIYTYLIDGETEGAQLTYEALDRQARAIAALLQSYQASGERALLLYPAGLEFIAAFFGCLYAGVIAVPLPPPNMAQPHRALSRLRAIANDAHPTVVLTTSSILAKIEGCSRKLPGCARCVGWRPTRCKRRRGGMARSGRDRATHWLCSNTPRAPPPYRGA